MERIKNNAQHVAIGALMALAVVMSILLAIPSPQVAQATALNSSGDIMMVTAGPAGGDDLLNVIDTRNGRILTYQYNGSKLVLVATRLLIKG